VTNSWGSATRLTLDDTDVTDGCARFGGGNILVDGSRKGGATVLEVTNGSTVSGGQAELGGGIGAVQHARVSVADSVISGNTAGTVGGGLAFRNASDGVLDGAQVTGNTSQVGGGIFHSTFAP